MTNLSYIIDVIQKIISILAIIAGGLFTYYKFIKGRVYRSRLEPDITGEIIQINDIYYLKIIVSIKNIGISKILINKEGTAISKYFNRTIVENTQLNKVEWDETKFVSFDVFIDHSTLESGEYIGDNLLIILPRDRFDAIKIELRIVSRDIEWSTSEVLLNK